jgi:hypothetical protein
MGDDLSRSKYHLWVEEEKFRVAPNDVDSKPSRHVRITNRF